MNALNKRRNEDLTTLAWQIAAFDRQKRLPKLDALLKDPEEKKEQEALSREFIQSIKKNQDIKLFKGGKIYNTVKGKK